jgi:hypothetical protein
MPPWEEGPPPGAAPFANLAHSPMPPSGGIAGAAFFSGLSATIASVVTSNPATDAASCDASWTTSVGR